MEMSCTVNIEPISTPLQSTSPIQPSSPIQENSVPETPKMLPSIAKGSPVDTRMTYVDETQNEEDKEEEKDSGVSSDEKAPCDDQIEEKINGKYF